MQGGEKLSLEQIRALSEASQEIRFAEHSRSEVYDRVGRTMREHDYPKQGRQPKGLVRAYVRIMTGLSRAQVTRLVAMYLAEGEVKETAYRRHRFAARYTRTGVEPLAKVDEAHETLAGPATRKILERAEEKRQSGNSIAARRNAATRGFATVT